jgi:outer membrane biosynthesis protein TonB
MKKAKLILLSSGLGLILLTCLQVFSAGKGHVEVVKDNVQLNTALTTAKSENKKLKTQVSILKTQVTKLEKANDTLNQIINPEPEIVPEVKPEPVAETKKPEKQVLPKKPKPKNEKASINNPDNSSGFSINAISDPEGN